MSDPVFNKPPTRCPDCNTSVLSLLNAEGQVVLMLGLNVNVYVLESYSTTTGMGAVSRSRASYAEHRCRAREGAA